MKISILSFCLVIIINSFLIAQKYEPITIKAGTSIKDYFPASQRYLYPEFTRGKVTFKNKISNPSFFNFNMLTGEMEFLKSKDTLFFAIKKELDLIVVEKDTFYYHDAFLQKVRSGSFSVYLKRSVELKNILKQGAMGTVNRSAASETYHDVLVGQRSIDLKPVDDILIQRKDEYFFSIPGYDFVNFNKRNIMKIIPGKESEIRKFVKSNNLDLESGADLLRVASFLSNLLSDNQEKK